MSLTMSRSQGLADFDPSRLGRKTSLSTLSHKPLTKSEKHLALVKPSPLVYPLKASKKPGHPVSPFSAGTSSMSSLRRNSHAISFSDLSAPLNAAISGTPKRSSSTAPCGSALNWVKEKKLMKSASATALFKAGSPHGKSSVRLPPIEVEVPQWRKNISEWCQQVKSEVTPKTPLTGESRTALKQSLLGFSSPTLAEADISMCEAQETPEAPETPECDEDTSAGVSFMIPDAPTLDEAMQRFQTGILTDGEGRRVHRAFRRFAGCEEELDKEDVDLVISHLGYILMPEEDMESISKDVSYMSTLDCADFMSFLQGCCTLQNEMLMAAFDEHAHVEEAGLVISVDVLPAVLRDLHFIVLGDVMDEVLQRAGLEGKALLNCEDVALVLAAYRSCEGFTVEQLKEAREKFDEAAGEKGSIGVSDVANTLLDFFGVSCVKQLRELVEAAGDSLSYCGLTTHPVTFHEFTTWARHLQNAGLLELREHFELVDDDGLVTRDGMMTIMKHQGFTLSQLELQEFLAAADLPTEEDNLFSFNDVHAFLAVCRESEGFRKEDLAELKAAFEKFDEEEEGELTTMQVLDLLRFCGYLVSLEEVEKYANQVDFNANGTMDIDEYMRLMRLHCEDEIADMQRTFFQFVGGVVGRLPMPTLNAALKDIKCGGSDCDMYKELCQLDAIDKNAVDISFEEFWVLVCKGRKAVKIAQRKKAAFSDSEFAVLQKSFAKFDTLEKGVLDKDRLLLLLHNSGVAVNSVGHKWGVDMLDKARVSALDADISSEDVGEFGSYSMTFWSMVHAWRLIARESEVTKCARYHEATLEAKFSVAEVEEFQKVFSESTKCKENRDAANELLAVPEISYGRRGSMPTLHNASAHELDIVNDVKQEANLTLQSVLGTNEVMLDFQDFKKVLGKVHMKVGPTHVKLLERQMEELTGHCHGSLDFPNFLLIMRWMLDTDFAHLNDLAASAAKNLTSAKEGAVGPDAPDSQIDIRDDHATEGLKNPKVARLLGRRASM